MPSKLWSSEVLKKDIKNITIISSHKCRSAAINRIAEKKNDSLEIKRALKEARTKRRQCLRDLESADQEVERRKEELDAIKRETARLQESVRTLLDLPAKIDELIDSSFDGEMIFGKMPPPEKMFT